MKLNKELSIEQNSSLLDLGDRIEKVAFSMSPEKKPVIRIRLRPLNKPAPKFYAPPAQPAASAFRKPANVQYVRLESEAVRNAKEREKPEYAHVTMKHHTLVEPIAGMKEKVRYIAPDIKAPQQAAQQTSLVPAATAATPAIMPAQMPVAIPAPMFYPAPPRQHQEMMEEAESVEGIGLPEIKQSTKVKLEELKEEDLLKTDIKYPLIPRDPQQGERIFAYANIRWDEEKNSLVYIVVEPELDEYHTELLQRIRVFIEEKIDIDFSKLEQDEAVKYIFSMFQSALEYFRVVLDPETEEIFKYYIFRDYIGLGVLEPAMNDGHIEDISCDGINIPLFIYHRDPRFGSLESNRMFLDKDELDGFVMKISERCGKTISIAKPLIDGSLPDGSRLQATLGSDIARHGSNFTVRRFTDKPLTATDMLKNGTMDLTTLAYLWLGVEYGASILISGGTATGKTSLLNMISMFIKSQLKIISIEDTPELQLAHPHWISEVARTSVSETGHEVDMFELLKESMRQRPDYIVVGEVRGKEAYVLFQQMATGHPGLATIHADSMPKLIDRLTTKPIELEKNLLQNLDIIMFIQRIKQERRYIRRVTSIVEVLGYDYDNDQLITNTLMLWNPKNDDFKILRKSHLMKKIVDRSNLTEADIEREIKQRAEVLEWMAKKEIADFSKVTEIINAYYMSPGQLLKKIRGEA